MATTKHSVSANTAQCEAARVGSEIADLWHRISAADEASMKFEVSEVESQTGGLVKVAANCAMRCLEERKDFLEFQLAGLNATSPQGVLAQLLVANGATGMAHEASDQWLRAEYQKLSDQLIHRITGYLERQGGQSVSELGLDPYLGAEHSIERFAALQACIRGSQTPKVKSQTA